MWAPLDVCAGGSRLMGWHVSKPRARVAASWALFGRSWWQPACQVCRMLSAPTGSVQLGGADCRENCALATYPAPRSQSPTATMPLPLSQPQDREIR